MPPEAISPMGKKAGVKNANGSIPYKKRGDGAPSPLIGKWEALGYRFGRLEELFD